MLHVAFALVLALLNGSTGGAEIHIDFYTVSATTTQVELTIEATAFVAGAASDKPAEPRKITRYLTWNTGATTSNDNSELAGLVARALKDGGLDTSSDGSETIIKDAVSIKVKSNNWTALGAQVWAVAPKGAKSTDFTISLDVSNKSPRAIFVLGAGARTGRPKVPEGDDGLGAAAPAADLKSKPGDKQKPAQPKPAPAKPKDPKAKKPIEVAASINDGSDAAAIKQLVTKSAGDAGWKVESPAASQFKIAETGDGRPAWASVRYASSAAGDATVGLSLQITAADTKEKK